MHTDKHPSVKHEAAFVRIFAYVFFVFVLFFAASNAFGQNPPPARELSRETPNLDVLNDLIRSGEAEKQRDALVRIRNLKTAEASRIALPALTDKSEIVRATAASSVVFLPADEAARAILPLLKDKNEFVRKEAAFALGKTRSLLAVSPLTGILQNERRLEVKSAAAIALGEIGDASAIENLTGVLQTARKPEEEFLRRSAARAIGQIAQFIQTGEIKIVTPENFVLDVNRVRQTAKYPRLTESFPVFRRAASVLVETLRNERETGDVRREAAFALGALGDRLALPALRARFNAEDYFLAQICREAAAKITENQTAPDSAR